LTINHHLDEATILAYAAGTLDAAMSVVVASHVAMCGECRASVRAAEQVGGELLAGLDVNPVSDGCRESTFARLETATIHRLPVRQAARVNDNGLPLPLQRLLGPSGLDGLNWKKKMPGIALADVHVPAAGRTKLKIMSIAPGMAMPEHGHRGEELTLVLKGAYSDEIGYFGAGDIADLDEDVEHRPIVEAGETCICLVAYEAPARFKSVIAKLLQPYIGI
jgi:putative transcriptional regulator